MKAKIESYKSGAIYSAGLSVVVKFIAFFQNFLIAYYLGAGTDDKAKDMSKTKSVTNDRLRNSANQYFTSSVMYFRFCFVLLV